jgi:hypothetical protein
MTTLPGIPPNMSLAAAISAGLVPRSLQLTGYAAPGSLPNPTIASLSSAAGAQGTGPLSTANAGSGGSNNALGSAILSIPDGNLNTNMQSMSASAITTANPPQLG